MFNSNAFDYINVLDKAADASWTRNEVIANNIANVDTPGYKRQDINFEDELEKVNVIPVRFTVLIQENVWPQVPRILVNQWMFFVEFLDSIVYNGLCSGSRNEKQEM